MPIFSNLNQKESKIKIHNFTINYNGRTGVIFTDISILNLPLGNLPQFKPFKTKAIWDTGASGSVITKKIASELNLIPMGQQMVKGVNREEIRNVYHISIILPNGVKIDNVKATECDELNGPFEVLIGMDIISLGDFALTNKDGKSVFTFRIPSITRIDFVKEENNINITRIKNEGKPVTRALNNSRVGRNDPCPCGSGLKYKKCHGK